MSQRDLSGRLARWSLKLQRFDFRIEHRKGSLNIVPDCLSRMEIDQITLGNITTEINLSAPEFDDGEYRELRETIVKNKESLPDLRLSGKVVLKRVAFRNGFDDDEENLWRIWVPKPLTKSIIESAHDSNSSCHGGFLKTLHRIRTKYFWPSMVNDVKAHMKSCEICKSIKSSNKVTRPVMGNQFVTYVLRLPWSLPLFQIKKFHYIHLLGSHDKICLSKAIESLNVCQCNSIFQTEIFPTFGVPH